jgi:hypothetical protein
MALRCRFDSERCRVKPVVLLTHSHNVRTVQNENVRLDRGKQMGMWPGGHDSCNEHETNGHASDDAQIG